ncbi:MAG: hypothetical protein M1831_002800 [Alyxoria varia]|nr:MAG: hypothetical protein M1831_002800 [Alyxoria varia]
MPAASESSETVASADSEAAESIHNGAEWQSVHEVWTRKTHLTLSPASFGKRILDVKSNRPPTNGVKHRPSHSSSSKTLPPPPRRASKPFVEYRPSVNGTALPPVNGLPNHGHHHPSSESSPSGRADLDRIGRMERSVGQLQAEMHDVRISLDQIRHDLRSGHGSGRGRGDDSATLEILSDTISSTSAKVGEIDGIKIQLDNVKRRLNRVEDGPEVPTPQRDQFPRPSSNPKPRPNPSPYQPHVSVPSPHSHEHEPRGWAAANSNKRKSVAVDGYAEPMQSEFKKQRTDVAHYDNSGRYNSTYSRPETALAPIHTDTQESWRSSLPGFQQRSGRMRKSPPENIGTPEWEKDSWNNKQVDEDGYYRPLGGVSSISPGTHDHGRLIRRASGGGAGGAFQYMDNLAASKKTRQKPIRNSEGILIRKDGKPDQRSISSPMNLKKVHARKMAEAETGHPLDISNPESPVGPSPLGRSESNMEYNEGRSTSNSPAPEYEMKEGKHVHIMRQMFPNGIDEDSDRMHHANHIFANDKDTDARIKSRQEIVKEEARSFSEEDREGSESRRDSGETSHTTYSNTAAVEANHGAPTPTFRKPERPIVQDSQPSHLEESNERATTTQTSATVEGPSAGDMSSRKAGPSQAVESTAELTRPVDSAESDRSAIAQTQGPGCLYQPSTADSTKAMGSAEPSKRAMGQTQDSGSLYRPSSGQVEA